jgi:hypothetical protein
MGVQLFSSIPPSYTGFCAFLIPSRVLADLVEAVIAVGADFLIPGRDNQYLATMKFDATDFQARRLHRLNGALDITPAEIAWRVRHNKHPLAYCSRSAKQASAPDF